MLNVLGPAQASEDVAAMDAPIVRRLQEALNSSNEADLKGLLVGEQALEMQSRFRNFSAQFSDANWSVSKGEPLQDGRNTVNVAVSAIQQQGGVSYAVDAKQRLALITEAGLIVGQEVIDEQSILRNAIKPLPISLMIPDAVLTGSRYDVDVILENPLGEAMVAGGLISLTPDQVRGQFSPAIQLEPLGGGGLFKSVKAPLKPGHQTWAALLVHPDGLVSVTKRVRVVNTEASLTP